MFMNMQPVSILTDPVLPAGEHIIDGQSCLGILVSTI